MKVDHRLNELRSFMNEKGITVAIITNPDNQFYLSNFKALTYSRPITLILEEQNMNLIVPAIEEVHANDEAKVDQVFVYYEHPEMAHVALNPYFHVGEILSRYASKSKIAVDMAYTSAELVVYIQELGFEVTDIGRQITIMRYIKDEEELELMEAAGRLVNLAVSESLNACMEGVTELEVDNRGNHAVLLETARSYPNATIDLITMSPSGIERTIMPHVFSNTRKLKMGDVLIHSRQVALNGYRAELERTIFIGKYTDEQEKAFEAARISQQVALDFIKPGVTAAEVDDVSRKVLEKEGFGKYAIHRVGHGIGVSAHEEPSLRFDNELVLKEGMVFTLEPGIFVPGVGGFRHSDTVILTKNGNRFITEYPRDLVSLIR